MSKIDLEILYLILTKTALKETFYSYEVSKLPQNQLPGTITYKHMSEIYERITGNSAPWRFEWKQPLLLLSELLSRCKLPVLASVAVSEKNSANELFRPGEGYWSLAGVPTSFNTSTKEQIWLVALKKVHDTKWPPFKNLNKLYR